LGVADQLAVPDRARGHQDGWTHRNFLRCIARLGGFIGRKSDGEPGWITIWRGWQFLLPMVEGFNLARGERCG
jgi:hypothetical protein